ncbi:Pyridine nucleotide-disulfide oxidoreductase [Carboxydocella thermautotrophica]|nr:Pyridine nucleotide-disulfide oxidoreductase [Carboxydocella thermautotrophica]
MACLQREIVIIGNSIAGITAAQELRRLVPWRKITILTAETEGGFYSKPLLTYFLAQKIQSEQIYIKTAAAIKEQGIEQITDYKVQAIDVNRRLIVDKQGKEIQYQKLLIASGADPVAIDLPGVELKGVTPLRTLEHLQIIKARLQQTQKCAIIGGGLVGLKTAWALRELDKQVSMIISSSYPFSQGLDKRAGEILAAHLIEHGIELIFGDNPVAFTGSPEQGLTALQTARGRTLPAGLAVIGKGVNPNSDFLGREKGIPVNQFQETEYENIYAAGDVTLAKEKVTGKLRNLALWPVAARQGLIAARNMAGHKTAWDDYQPGNSAHFGSLRLITGGLSPLTPAEAEGEVIKDRGKEYQKLVFLEGTLAGFILLGASARIAGPLSWGLGSWKKAQALDWFSRKKAVFVE